MFREMTTDENEIINRLLENSFPGRDQIRSYVMKSRVQTVDGNGSFEFEKLSNISLSNVRYPVPTEAECLDDDGITIHFLLHVVGQWLCEIEIYKENHSPVKSKPMPEKLIVFSPQ